VRSWLLALPLLTSCVTARLERERQHQRSEAAILATLEPEHADLDTCLRALGAPLWVQEHRVFGLALAYGHRDELAWRVSASVPVTQDASASFRYEQGETGLYGHVLYFDRDWRLERVVAGWLDVIRPAVAPASIEELEEERP
jgi:hypothetical protein